MLGQTLITLVVARFIILFARVAAHLLDQHISLVYIEHARQLHPLILKT